MAAFFNSGTMKIGLTIKSIVRWEQLRKKSFSLMDYSDREDVDAYCTRQRSVTAKG